MFPLRRLVATLALAVLVAVPRFAAADDSHPYGRTPLSQKEKLRWNGIMRDAKKLAEDEHWTEASTKFSEAIKLDPHPDAYLWKGYTEERLGHLLIARALYAEAGNEAKTDELPQLVQKSEKALAQLGKKIPLIVVHLPADVRARIAIDGAPMPVAPEGVGVNPGSRSLDVSAPGRESFHIQVKAEEGKVYRFEPQLRLLPPETPGLPVEGLRGCGACSVGDTDGALLPGSLATLAAILFGARRRSKRRM